MSSIVMSTEVDVEPDLLFAPVFSCRRCPNKIDTAVATAHLVRRQEDDYPLGEPLVDMVIICDGCLGVNERGMREGPRPAFVYVAPPKRLTFGQETLLEQLMLPGDRVYRVAKRILAESPSGDRVRNVTHLAYELVNGGYAKWEVIPHAVRTPGGPTAWLRATDQGVAYFENLKGDE